MDEKERIFIIIDGNNFYHRLKETFQSYGLITHSDIRRLLTKEDIEQFLI